MSALVRRLRSFTVVVTALAGGLATAQDLEQGKSGAQLFATNCMDCHHSPKGLARDRSSWTLSSFLQEHYTTSSASVHALTAYLQSADPHRSNPGPAGQNRRAAENGAPALLLPLQALVPPPPVAHNSRAQKNSENSANSASTQPPRPPESVPAR
jgi:mono/diheme cytochrome c family protein